MIVLQRGTKPRAEFLQLSCALSFELQTALSQKMKLSQAGSTEDGLLLTAGPGNLPPAVLELRVKPASHVERVVVDV